jgi:ribonuclease VapC
MFLDTSAVVEALITGPHAEDVAARLKVSTTQILTAPTVIYEATAVLSTKLNISVPDAEDIVRQFMRDFGVLVAPITDETASVAIDAFARYGKGRHPAKLNFGDCFSYAGARAAQVPLLYVGSDFAQTDLA